MKIIWTPTARITYIKVLVHLSVNWTKKEVENFINEVEALLEQISSNPEMFQALRKRKNVRKGHITRHNTLYSGTIRFTIESNPGRRSLN